MTVITNIEEDHLDHYKNLEEIRHAFETFIQKAGEKGVAVLNLDCEETKRMVAVAPGKVVTYGFDDDAQLQARNWRQEQQNNMADIYYNNVLLGTVVLHVPGRHNISNGLLPLLWDWNWECHFRKLQRDWRSSVERDEDFNC